MKSAIAKSKYIRISPRKARLAAALARGQEVERALALLQFSGLKAGRLISKTLDSAIANAEANHGMDREQLYVKELRIDEGPTWKRARPKCRGGRAPIRKRTSHITVIVAEQQD